MKIYRCLLRCAVLILLGCIALSAHTQGNDWNRLDADEPAPTFTLTDQEGRQVALEDYRGKVILLTFIYTECKDICPVLPQIIGRVDKWLQPGEREHVRLVGVSLDPNRDTPAKLKGFMGTHNLSSERWTLLTGTMAEATQVVKDYGVVVRPDLQGELVHNAVYVLIDAKGQLRTEFHGLFAPSNEIAKALGTLIAEARAASGSMKE